MRDTFELTEQHVRRVLLVRRAISEIIGADLFSDLAREIILELMAARLSGEQVLLDQLEELGPASTVSRWLTVLQQHGVVVLSPAPSSSTMRVELAGPAAIRLQEAISRLWWPARPINQGCSGFEPK